MRIVWLALVASVGVAGLQPLPAQQAPTVVRISSGVATGHILKKTYPQLTTEEERVGGNVQLHVRIDTAGHVSRADVVSGPPAKAAAVARAVRQWEYRPFEQDGMPVEVDTSVSMDICFGGPDRRP